MENTDLNNFKDNYFSKKCVHCWVQNKGDNTNQAASSMCRYSLLLVFYHSYCTVHAKMMHVLDMQERHSSPPKKINVVISFFPLSSFLVVFGAAAFRRRRRGKNRIFYRTILPRTHQTVVQYRT